MFTGKPMASRNIATASCSSRETYLQFEYPFSRS
jgi:hypothetical protein